jgi:hypothetical protein
LPERGDRHPWNFAEHPGIDDVSKTVTFFVNKKSFELSAWIGTCLVSKGKGILGECLIRMTDAK